MRIQNTLVMGLAPLICSALGVTCNSSTAAKSGDTCSSFSSKWALTVQQFVALNPGIACPGKLVGGQVYCVAAKASTGKSTSSTPGPTKTQPKTSLLSSVVTTPPTSTQSGNGVATPVPIQDGMTSKCSIFRLVGFNEACSDILEYYNLPMSTFYSWNPTVGSTCTNLQPGYNYCVGTIGRPMRPTNGISTPWPVQTSMVTNCNKFYKVRLHDNCYSVTSKFAIPMDKFHAWNPSVGSRCTNLIAYDYVCVGRIGYNPSTITTGKAVATPEPFQPGIVGNCNRFYYVKSGDTCKSIAAKEKVAVSDIQKWNPKAAPRCTNLWLHFYICIGVKS